MTSAPKAVPPLPLTEIALGHCAIGDETVGHIVIGHCTIGDFPLRNQGWMSSLSAKEVLAQLEAIRAQGSRALVVTFDYSPGGCCDHSFRIYDALRNFSKEGGAVVAHLRGNNGSSAPIIALAANVIVIEPGARLLLHEVQSYDPEQCTEGSNPAGARTETSLAIDQWSAQVCELRTTAPRAEIDRWFSVGWKGVEEEVVELAGDAIRKFGWADVEGDLNLAASIAAILARGGNLISSRGEALRNRAEPISWKESGLSQFLANS